jgi:hypothetical protein
MNLYNPDKFKSLYQTALGQELWAFLNEDLTVSRLVAFSEADRPAVQGIEEALLNRFGNEVCEDRVKQMIGHMVRQVLESRGWVIEQQNVNVFSVPFIKATRYRRLDRCRFFVFRRSTDARNLCLTKSKSAVLPHIEGGGEWRYWTTLSSPLRASIVFDLTNLSDVERDINRDGYFTFHHRRAMRAA